MISKKTILSVGLLAIAMPHMASAQALKGVKTPANLPPADYNGVQFVDHKGCIFVRAGRLGDISWVPRIDQTRKHMCSKTYASTFPKADEKPVVEAVEPTAVAALDRGKVAYKGDVIKPVAAPDTSLVQIKENTLSAAQKAKQAATKAAEAEREAQLAAQEIAADKLRQDAIAKKEADDAKKAEQLASAMKAAEEAAVADDVIKAQIAEKITQDKQARLEKRAADKKARALALEQKKADAKAARDARNAKREADRLASAKKREETRLASLKKREEAKVAAANKKAEKVAAQAAAKSIKVAKVEQVVTKPSKVAEVVKAPVKKVNEKAAALKEAAIAKKVAIAAAKKARADEKAADEAAKAQAFPSGYYVDLGTNLNAARAQAVVSRLSASGYRVQTRVTGNTTQVFAGPFRSQSNARVAFYQVTNEGFKKATVVKK